MMKKFMQLSKKPGFMLHNGGLLFKQISKSQYEFKTKINKKKLNRAGNTHGGYIASIIDAGSGSAAYRAAENRNVVTVSLDVQFIGTTKLGDEINGFTKIIRRTKSMVFLICHLKCDGKIIASANGIWKILKKAIEK